MSVFDRLAKESEAERQEWARRNAQTSSESTARVQQDFGRGGLFDRLEKESEAERLEWANRNNQTALESSGRAQQEESEAERKEWAARNARTALESSQRAGNDYRGVGSELAPASSGVSSAAPGKIVVPSGAPSWPTIAESVKQLITTNAKNAYLQEIQKNVKSLDRGTNEDLARALSRAATAFNNTADDFAEGVTSQAMNHCKNSPNADRGKWAQALKSFRSLMQGIPSEMAAIQNNLISLPEWTKTHDLLINALNTNTERLFNLFAEAISGAIAKITV